MPRINAQLAEQKRNFVKNLLAQNSELTIREIQESLMASFGQTMNPATIIELRGKKVMVMPEMPLPPRSEDGSPVEPAVPVQEEPKPEPAPEPPVNEIQAAPAPVEVPEPKPPVVPLVEHTTTVVAPEVNGRYNEPDPAAGVWKEIQPGVQEFIKNS